MQVTIDLPDDLARQLEPEQDRLVEIIRRGLARPASYGNALAEEVIEFFAQGPAPSEILEFRASEQSAQRMAALLDKNRESELNSDERDEIDQMCAWNDLVALIKAQTRLKLHAATGK